MPEGSGNVLFLCTASSARRILAEALPRHRGEAGFGGFSAGSFPQGAVHPRALVRKSRRSERLSLRWNRASRESVSVLSRRAVPRHRAEAIGTTLSVKDPPS